MEETFTFLGRLQRPRSNNQKYNMKYRSKHKTGIALWFKEKCICKNWIILSILQEIFASNTCILTLRLSSISNLALTNNKTKELQLKPTSDNTVQTHPWFTISAPPEQTRVRRRMDGCSTSLPIWRKDGKHLCLLFPWQDLADISGEKHQLSVGWCQSTCTQSAWMKSVQHTDPIHESIEHTS